MKTVVIVGGLGPESTIDYYRSIISLYRRKVADGSYPSIIIGPDFALLSANTPHVVFNDVRRLSSLLAK